jgi:hypothetical protein
MCATRFNRIRHLEAGSLRGPNGCPLSYVLGGGLVCDAGHQLRVTCRCIREDLGREPPIDFEALARHPIVEAFQGKREAATTAAKTVGPDAGERTLHHLGIGDDHRGATWWEEEAEVVWLCAYGFHRSGEPEDAFPYFRELIEAQRIYPTEEDYQWLERDLANGFANRVEHDAPEMLASARAQPGTEVSRVIGGNPIGVYVEVLETLEETFVILDLRTTVDYAIHALILAAFYPDKGWDDWHTGVAAPHRQLGPTEFAYSTLHN